jgi:GNAT superfamily N-acetyltransferase
VNGFECGEPALDHGLKHRALQNERHGASRTYMVCVEHRVIADFGLATAQIESRRACPTLRRNMPDPIPMLVLCRLAVDRACQRHGLGSLRLRDAILRTVQVSDVVGVKGLLVHALTDAAARFYESHGLHRSPTEERTLFLSLAEVLR